MEDAVKVPPLFEVRIILVPTELVLVIVPPTKRVLEMYPGPCTENKVPGVVVAIPTLPPEVPKYADPVLEIAVVEA